MREYVVRTAQTYLSGTTVELIRLLDPEVYIPFAGGYLLGGKNAWMNQFKGVCELDDLETDLVPMVKGRGLQGEMLILEQGGVFDVTRGGIYGKFKGTDFKARKEHLDNVLSKKKFDFEDDPEPVDLYEGIKSAHQTLLRKQKQYDYFSDWKVLIDHGDGNFLIPFGGGVPLKDVKTDNLTPCLYTKIDKRLLARIIDRRANWNNAEVGSHLIYNPIVFPGQKAHEPMVNFLMPYFQGPYVG